MAIDTERTERSPAQRAHVERLNTLNAERRQAAAPTERQTFLARQRGRRSYTREDAEELLTQGQPSPAARQHTAAGVISIEHETDVRVKLWKRGPYGWGPRLVPSKSIANNLANGWMEHCPDCYGMELEDGTVCSGTECTDDPNTCPAKRGRRFIVCPVPTCNQDTGRGPKHIYATGFGHLVDEAPEQERSEFEIASPYRSFDTETELRGKMDRHIMTFHRDEAQMLGLFNTGPAAPRLGMDPLEP